MTTHVDPNAAARPDSGLFGLDPDPAEARVHVVAVPFDATASYRKGAHRGPAAVLRASHQVDLYDVATGRPYEAGIALLAPDPRLAAWNERASPLADRVIELGGDVEHDPGARIALEEVNAIGTHLNGVVREATERALDEERLPAILGGDHSVPFGAIEAAAARFPGLGVLHVDAHADLRHAYEGFTWSHASIMDNVARRIENLSRLVQVGIRDVCEEEVERIEASAGRIRALFDRDWQQRAPGGRRPARARARVDRRPAQGRVDLVRRRRPRARALPEHGHARARRPRLGRAPASGSTSSRARAAAWSASTCARSTRAMRPRVPTPGTRSSARACSTA